MNHIYQGHGSSLVGLGGESFVVIDRVCVCWVFCWGYCGFFFKTQRVFTLTYNFRTMFCYLDLTLIRILVWGTWHLLSDVFVSFQSRSKLYSEDFLEVSQVLHCSPWAVMGTSEHR